MNMIPMPTNRKEKKEAKGKKLKVSKESLYMHGFDMDMLRMYPHGIQEGDFPALILRKDCDEKVQNIQEKVWKPLIKEHIEKKHFPTLEHVQLVYEQYCQNFNASPILLKDYFSQKKGIFAFKN